MNRAALPLILITVFSIDGCSSNDDNKAMTNDEVQQEFVVDTNSTYGVFA